MKIDITGDALKLLNDFIKYGRLYTGELSDAMYYCEDGFIHRLNLLEQAVLDAEKRERARR